MLIASMLILGLLIGSFINAVVWRLHSGGSVWRGRSMCPNCKHQLEPVDLVPIVSWLALRGKCRYCGVRVSPQYPLVELITMLLFGLSYVLLQPAGAVQWLEFGFWLYILTALIVLAVYDLRWLLLPDKVLLPAIVVTAIRLGTLTWIEKDPQLLAGYLAAALVAGGFFYFFAAISNGRWMGGGDIKLAFLMGLLLGPRYTALAMLLAFNVAAVVAVALLLLKIKKRKDYIPFGPFLVGGTIIAALYGPTVISWYLSHSSLGML